MIAECKIYFVTDVRTLIAALGWGQTRLPSSNTYLLPIFIINGNIIATKNNRRTNVKKKLWKRIRTHSANIIKTSRLIFHKVKVTSRRWVARKIRIAPTSYITESTPYYKSFAAGKQRYKFHVASSIPSINLF